MNKWALIVQSQGCSRSHKIAYGLTDLGWTMFLMQQGNRLSTWGFQPYKAILSMGSNECDKCWREALNAATNNKDTFDVIHSSNTPDVYTNHLVVNSKRPVIHDCHDALTTFNHVDQSTAGYAEALANQRADGNLFVSEGQRQYVIDTYNIDIDKSYVFPNYYLERFATKYPRTKLSDMDGQIHLVWEGGIKMYGEADNQWADHRDIWRLFKKLLKQGIHVHVHSSIEFRRGKNRVPLESPNLHWHNPTDLSTLMRVMTQYDAGIVAFNKTNEEFLEHTLPNKMFESFGAGLPVLCDNSRDVKNWVQKYDVGEPILEGWETGDIEKITFKNINPYISNVENQKDNWTVEANIGGLEKFYEKIAKRGR